MSTQNRARAVIKQEIKGLQALSQRIDKRFDRALDLLSVPGKIILTGVGKSGHVCKKLSSTLTSLGTPAMFMHPTEAAHGDLRLIEIPGVDDKGKPFARDAILVLSRSGKAQELVPILHFASEHSIPTVLVSESYNAGLALMVDATIKLPQVGEAWGHAPTTSTIMQMAVGDALAVCLAERRGWTEEQFIAHHPSGELGQK